MIYLIFSYYACVLGQPFKGECPEGLLFNIQKSQCDLAENVQCQIIANNEAQTNSEEEYEEEFDNSNIINNSKNDEYDW